MGGRKNSRSGFTLIELLVVIAIIALLASLLMPGLNKALGRAKSATCASNLKQLAIATFMYLDDHEGKFFLYSETTPQVRHWYDGDGPLIGGGYLGMSEKVFKTPKSMGDCPANKTGVLHHLGWHLDYGYNKHAAYRTLDQYPRSSEVILFMDNANSAINPNAYSFMGINSPGEWFKPEQVQFIHNGAANAAHMDGHVATYTFDDISNKNFIP